MGGAAEAVSSEKNQQQTLKSKNNAGIQACTYAERSTQFS